MKLDRNKGSTVMSRDRVRTMRITGASFRMLLLLLPSLLPAAEARTTEPAAFAVTTEESMDGRGRLKFGDKCNTTQQCGFRGSVCDATLKLCQCVPELPVTNHLDKCGKAALYQTECRDGLCVCRFDKTPVVNKLGKIDCVAVVKPTESTTHVDPAMIGILAGMALMFIIICVVLRLFSKARWRENRTIFNTPNPRLMNVSLLQHNKSIHESRRGSKGSVRGPSRAASVTSLRTHSPTASQASRNGGSRRNSHNSQGSSSPNYDKSSLKNEEKPPGPEKVTVESELLQNNA
ncbi:UNVERIFIED_CONTAM: hypothetical protein PYX00_008752 [Menopon gallinae]|uniref:Uncharacterized protein n=1 Tax=Menopon gallinae TaxID=328185 RepID=A0AAW2HPK6_9NEOP